MLGIRALYAGDFDPKVKLQRLQTVAYYWITRLTNASKPRYAREENGFKPSGVLPATAFFAGLGGQRLWPEWRSVVLRVRAGICEYVLEDVQRRLEENSQAMRVRRETVEHPFETIKARMGATHFLTRRLKNVKTFASQRKADNTCSSVPI
jgi:hypothetical protein